MNCQSDPDACVSRAARSAAGGGVLMNRQSDPDAVSRVLLDPPPEAEC